MTDKKLTESEIVKLLECCKKSQCSNCEYSKKCDGYTQVNYALDLITRQQAEIERLRKEVNLVSIQFQDLQERYEEAQAEIESLKIFRGYAEKRASDYKTMRDKYLNAKSEAVKECLTKVKNYIKTHCNPYGKPDFDYDTSIKILNFIDKLAKEMVGD